MCFLWLLIKRNLRQTHDRLIKMVSLLARDRKFKNQFRVNGELKSLKITRLRRSALKVMMMVFDFTTVFLLHSKVNIFYLLENIFGRQICFYFFARFFGAFHKLMIPFGSRYSLINECRDLIPFPTAVNFNCFINSSTNAYTTIVN